MSKRKDRAMIHIETEGTNANGMVDGNEQSILFAYTILTHQLSERLHIPVEVLAEDLPGMVQSYLAEHKPNYTIIDEARIKKAKEAMEK